MNQEPILVLVTVPTEDTADQIAKGLVERKLAACVNIVPAMRSVYQWEGKINKDDELLLIVKTVRPLFVSLSTAIKAMHPYELPEIIALDIVDGERKYLDWIARETNTGSHLKS